jgi:hypothetical protein
VDQEVKDRANQDHVDVKAAMDTKDVKVAIQDK